MVASRARFSAADIRERSPRSASLKVPGTCAAVGLETSVERFIQGYSAGVRSRALASDIADKFRQPGSCLGRADGPVALPRQCGDKSAIARTAPTGPQPPSFPQTVSPRTTGSDDVLDLSP